MSAQDPDYYSQLDHIRVYHAQLWFELRALLDFHRALCNEHQQHAEAAVARAALFLFFGAIETSTRILAAATLFISSSDENMLVRRLTQVESLFLQEQTAEIRQGSWSESKRTRFISLEAKLLGFPMIYGRLFGVELRLDKNSPEWQSFIHLKRLRDLGAHGSLHPKESGPERVTATDLRELLLARRWYCTQLRDMPWILGAEAQGEVHAIDSVLGHVPVGPLR